MSEIDTILDLLLWLLVLGVMAAFIASPAWVGLLLDWARRNEVEKRKERARERFVADKVDEHWLNVARITRYF